MPEDSFGPHLTRLTDWLNAAQRCGLARTLVVILDEFDEINPAMYLGQRGANFFATLRSLSEQQVIWVFVGGERIPNIFVRHHATLNQVEVCRVDRIDDPQDTFNMIVKPVKGMLEWDADAVNLIRHITSGNPYFVHLICQRILKEMYHSRRTFIDRADVTVVAKGIFAEGSPTHWGHLLGGQCRN